MKGVYVYFGEERKLLVYKELTTKRHSNGGLEFDDGTPIGYKHSKFAITLDQDMVGYTRLHFETNVFHWKNKRKRWHFKDAYDASIIILVCLRERIGKDVSKLIAQQIWKTRNELIWGLIIK